MASDGEAHGQRSSTPGDNIEFNGRTVHSFITVGGAANSNTGANTTSTEAVGPGDLSAAVKDATDENDNQDSSLGLTHRIARFLFFHTSPFASAVKTLLLSALVGVVGFSLFYWSGITIFIGISWLPAVFNCAAFVGAGYAVMLICLHACVVLAHRRPALYASELLHWITEFEKFLAAGIWIAVLLAVFSSVSGAVSTTEAEGAFASTVSWFFRQYLLAGGLCPNTLIRLSFVALLAISLLAAKRHFMHKLAIEFNYSNYADRVEESLFLERMMQALLRSRQAYRFRKKWRTFMNTPTAIAGNTGPSSNKKQIPAATTDTGFVNVTRSGSPSQVSTAETLTIPSLASPASPYMNAINSRPVSPSSGSNSCPSPSDTPAGAAANQNPPAQTQTQTQTQPSPPPQAQSRATKRQFEEFARLANRTLAQFDSLTGSDANVEIHREARRLAGALFKWLTAGTTAKVLKRTDLEPFIEDRSDLDRFLGLINRRTKNSTGEINETDLRRVIETALHERYGLAKSMETIEMALGKIDSILGGCIALVSVLLICMLLTVSAFAVITTLGTIISSAAFAFGTSAKNTFEAIIFLLVIHPFDVGDRVFINAGDASASGNPIADTMLVAEMHLMSTIFERWDGVRIYIPNHILANRVIYNLRRSGPIMDYMKMAFAHTTPIDRIETLKNRLGVFVKSQKQDFTDFHRINIDMLENCNRILVTVIVQHASNWQDLELQMSRRTKILAWIKDNIEDLGITYLPPPQPIKLIQ